MILSWWQVFKCRACVAASAQTSSLISPLSNVVSVKLPMVPVNGKRPIVELVMMQGGKYQPIKFSNNMQVSIKIWIAQVELVEEIPPPNNPDEYL